MTEKDSLQEMQVIEQNLQNILLQKNAFQMELSETKSALSEIEISGEEVYKIIGQLMIRTEKSKMKEELSNKEKIIELRLKTIDKQEASLTEKLERIRDEIIQNREKKKNK